MPPIEENILYVVFHGLITLIDVKDKDKNKDGFLAHVLDMGDDHQYLLGEWLQEAEIPERKRGHEPLRATLINVDSGSDELDPNLNAVIKLKTAPPDASSEVRAVLRLPRPRKIHTFISGKLPKGALAGNDTRLEQVPEKISGTQVFEYTFSDNGDKKPALVSDQGNVLWRRKALAGVKDTRNNAGAGAAPATPVREMSVAVLHIYDEPGIRLPGNPLRNIQDHNRREFRTSGVFLNSDLDLVKDTAKPDELDNSKLPPGLLAGEVTNLDERDKSIRAIVLGVRIGKSLGADTGGGSMGPVCGGMHARVS